MISLPHVRGGVSRHQLLKKTLQMSSPRAWGCFFIQLDSETQEPVFPTCVGVFLIELDALDELVGLPHVRGGVSQHLKERADWYRSSPRAWGCFSGHSVSREKKRVFPTCVGVFLIAVQRAGVFIGLPHVRGGVSVHS